MLGQPRVFQLYQPLKEASVVDPTQIDPLCLVQHILGIDHRNDMGVLIAGGDDEGGIALLTQRHVLVEAEGRVKAVGYSWNVVALKKQLIDHFQT